MQRCRLDYGFSLWNDGSLFPNGPDDVDFISTMIDELATSYHIDSSRVYATGLSNGGAMSYYLASQLPNRLAAIAPVAAPRPANPTAPRPLPVLHVHGTADSFVPIAGGFMNIPLPGGEYFSTFRVPAIDDVIDDWRESNGCVGEPVITQLPDLNTQDSSTVTLIRYEDGERYLTAAGDERSAEVLYYMIEGGGHTWPGGGMPALFGPTNRDINASAEIWNFFSRHELPAVVPVRGRLQPKRHRRRRRLRRVAQRTGNDLHADRLRRVALALRANGRQRRGATLRRNAVGRRA